MLQFFLCLYSPFHLEHHFAWASKNVNLYPDCPYLLFISMFTLMLFSALFKLNYSRNAVKKRRIYKLLFCPFLCWCKCYKLKVTVVPSQSLAHGDLVFHFYVGLFDVSKLDSLLCLLVPRVAEMFLPPWHCTIGSTAVSHILTAQPLVVFVALTSLKSYVCNDYSCQVLLLWVQSVVTMIINQAIKCFSTNLNLVFWVSVDVCDTLLILRYFYWTL